jgi:perosamine synthetase
VIGTSERLAIEGGAPVRASMLPYGRQTIDADDVGAVTEALVSDWLTTGPKVTEFESEFAAVAGADHAVAVSNGTGALHAAAYALEIHPGDEVVVPAMTFAATANVVVFQGGTPVFADVDPETLLLDPASVESHVTSRTKAVFAVDYAGHACDYDQLTPLCQRHGLRLAADACHALGGAYKDRPVGSLAELNTFSLHPVKLLTTAEGGVITTNDSSLAERMRLFRNHGITTDHRQRESRGSWFYEMVDLGFNYRLSDIQCALGLSQLPKLAGWIERRQAIARSYDEAFSGLELAQPLAVRDGVQHAFHLYVLRLEFESLRVGRAEIFAALRAEGIGVNVHYIPVHLHPYYRERFGTGAGLCPVAEDTYERILTLPVWPGMTDQDVDDVITAVGKVLRRYAA